MENRMPQWCFKNSLRLFFILWIICFNRCLLYLVKAQNRIPTETVQVWALEFGGELNSIVEKYSGSLLLQKKYKDVEPFIRIEEVDGVELVMQFGEKMKEMLRRKVEAVKRLVDAAEEADLYHKYDMNFEFDYYNSVLINERDKNGNYVELGNEFILEVNEHFNNLPVNTSLSNIQVPTNVYNKDPDILNGAYWSEALNTIFSDNFGQDPTLTWQYFGSSTGFFRLYPGIKWMPDENGVISFDCRNRGWYIQAATSPKDIIILFDISGSMKGLRMTIAKHTINTILDTLGENDFVNIIAYSDYIHYVEPCFEGTLVQADRDNREHFKLLVDKLNAKGTGVVTKALIEAFIILNKVRVFTYLIGREVTFAEYVKWIACNNKGYYTHISTLADVQENVMEYLHVLSRPMVINHDHDIIWTEAYMDSALFQSAAHSLLLMTTVAMPVFSRKNETRAHGILLGVVGTDVPLKELLKLAPRYKLGAHGYAFLNTNNGYILAHPDLRPLYKDGKKTKPKPNYNSVDISEVEWEDTYEVLRTAMVNGETGSFSMNVKVPIDDGKRVLFLTNDYFYTHIDDTPFSLCIVLTRGHGESLFIGNISVEEGLHDIDQPDLTLSNEWIYCVTDIDPDHRKLSQKEAVIRYLTGQEPDLECDEELLQEVLFDAVVTAPVEAYWTAIAMNISENNKDGVEMAFLGTRAGLMRSCPFVGKEKSSNKKFFTTQDRHSIFTMDHFPLWYRRAAEHPPGHFVYNIAFEEDIGKKNRSKMVTASTVVSVTVSKRMAIAAAVGVQINLRLMRQKFWMATRQSNDTDCSNIEGTCPISCDNDALNCFLIDNNGFILISKNEEETGKFLGEVDGSVMTQLLNMGLFTEVKLYDYQAMCKGATNHHSGSQPMLSPFYVILAALKWFLNNLFIFFIEFNLCDLWNREGLVNAKTVFHFGHKHRKVEAFQPCNTEYPAFVHDDTIKEANGFVECGDCQKMFVVQSIENSNLLLLVTEAYCDCSVFPPVTLEPKEVKYNASVKCERMRTQKLRRRPNTCHAFHPEVRKMQRSVEEHLGFLWLECCLHLMWAWLLFYNDEAAVLTNMQRTNLEALPTDAHKAINQAYFY
ncbi:voltage-dependent calcium channel subunit alpha-2/delta-4-like isoform X8 [Stegostoma tigrinum]|uniref:voltage-dependent calcium channel subunit alpha-2/delta-4-like isoform X8 n=1 Tax=Stegostoma tigrinum TaxID=3053191 RepID=UPI00286FEB66|nr:voltage-dependent calcium channel subunit alpha-2/delta-4-like isoform X8 [Stegostoma tigrinum]